MPMSVNIAQIVLVVALVAQYSISADSKPADNSCSMIPSAVYPIWHYNLSTLALPGGLSFHEYRVQATWTFNPCSPLSTCGGYACKDSQNWMLAPTYTEMAGTIGVSVQGKTGFGPLSIDILCDHSVNASSIRYIDSRGWQTPYGMHITLSSSAACL